MRVDMLRKQRKDQLKELIFNTSVQLFKEKGFESVTVDEITQTCGIAKGTFYNYFRKKDEILLQLGTHQMEVVQQVIIYTANKESVKERLLSIFQELFIFIKENQELAKVLFFEMLRSPQILEQENGKILEFQNALLPIVKEGIANQEIKGSMDPESLSSLFISIYFQSVINWLASPVKVKDPVSVFTTQFKMVWEGIGR
jgi:AcrR family transcriptional regulator